MKKLAQVGTATIYERQDGKLEVVGAFTLADAVEIDRVLRVRLTESGVHGLKTVAEVGKKGGHETRGRYAATDHFVEIGRKGGNRLKALVEAGKFAPTHYENLGKKGWETKSGSGCTCSGDRNGVTHPCARHAKGGSNGL